MTSQRRQRSSLKDRSVAAAVLIAFAVCHAAHAQQASRDQTQTAPAPPPEVKPTGDPKTGVVHPPEVDPKMSKQVPDIDPGMTQPPADKQQPADQGPPKVEPK